MNNICLEQVESMNMEMLKHNPYIACRKSVDILCSREESLEAVYCASCIDNGEIIEFDKFFDNIISDTAINVDDCAYLPFDLFFINKWFVHGSKIIPGIAVGKLPEGTIAFSYIIIDFFNDIVQAGFCGDLTNGMKHEDGEFKDISQHILNCINIINNPDKDIKEIERFPSHKKLNPTHRKYDPYARKTTYITVGGELKKYIGEYNKRRESVGHNPSYIVRGHWRHFRSPRYKNKQGQSRWIYPYIKGMPEELVHRFVKVVPGDSKK